MKMPMTKCSQHIGLTVPKLEQSAAFFVSVLGWKEVRRNDEYPAIFVSDGNVLVTLWATKEEPPVPFDRKSGIGLHHLAFQVDTEAALNDTHERLKRNGTALTRKSTSLKSSQQCDTR